MANKLRILCLPGWRTSAKFMSLQLKLSQFDTLLGDIVTFVPLNATFKSDKSPPSSVYQLEPEGPYYQWWNVVRKEGGVTDYDGIDESVDYVCDFIIKNGPFDGLLGFSQGAGVVHYLAALQGKKVAKLQGLFNFVIAVSGFAPADARFEHALQSIEGSMIDIPSLHIYGTQDDLYQYSVSCTGFYKNPIIVEHGRGHSFPKLQADERALKTVRSFLEPFIPQIHPKL